MSGRIADMRKGLRQRLEAKGTPGSWEHITNQIGMFSFTGLTEPQVKSLRENYHIYMVGLTACFPCFVHISRMICIRRNSSY